MTLLGLPEQPRVIEKMLQIIGAAELEDVDAGALFCYIEGRHNIVIMD